VNASTTVFMTRGPVAFLTINRPEAGNAMTWAMYDALTDACERVDAAPDLRAFVIRATGDVFCTGTDISQFATFATREDGLEYERRLETSVARLERVTIPTIAQVEGIAAGAGCAIALACDLRVCTPAARFGVPVARTLGNCLSATNYARILELVGPAHLKDLMFTGRLLDAEEAQRVGLVSRLVAADAIGAAVAELTSTIAANAPLTIRATKEAMRRILRQRRIERDALDDVVAACYTSDDFRNAVASCLAKRPAVFSGR